MMFSAGGWEWFRAQAPRSGLHVVAPRKHRQHALRAKAIRFGVRPLVFITGARNGVCDVLFALTLLFASVL